MREPIRIGTRESELAVWQAMRVKDLLSQSGITANLVYIHSEGDIDLKTPIYEMGVQGVFTRSLDIALLNNQVDIAVHSLKDVPTQLPQRIVQAAVLPRDSPRDLLVFEGSPAFLDDHTIPATIATSSIRRKAQWLRRYPSHNIENLRGNVNTRLSKLRSSKWNGAIFAAAGLERIGLRPANAIDLEWMLPAPAQGAIVVTCLENDANLELYRSINDASTEYCTRIERDFLRTLGGGCSAPVSALAEFAEDILIFRGSVVSIDGKDEVQIELMTSAPGEWPANIGVLAAQQLLEKGAHKIMEDLRHA